MKNRAGRSEIRQSSSTAVWLPFASGKVVEVELSSYPGENGGRPIVAYPVHDVGPDLVQAVDCAAEIAYRLARKISGKAWNTYCIGYRLKEMPAEARIAGESGGLAMSLAFYFEMIGLQARSIAATGRLTSLLQGGMVGAVEGIPEKLAGGLLVLNEGDIMFYPAENESDISREVQAAYAKRKIRLLAVGSVEEAISYLESEDGAGRKGVFKNKKILLALAVVVVAGVLLCALTFGQFFRHQKHQTTVGTSGMVKGNLTKHLQKNPAESRLPSSSKYSKGFE